MENNICSNMYEAVTAMCSFVAEENIRGGAESNRRNKALFFYICETTK